MRRIIKKEISQDKRTVMMQLDKEYRLMSIDTTKLRKFPYNYTLRNYDESLKGKVILLGFIYTHCPDICPKDYDINWTDWYFLTGDIEKAKYKVGETYFLSHMDRIFVIDKYGYKVENYDDKTFKYQ